MNGRLLTISQFSATNRRNQPPQPTAATNRRNQPPQPTAATNTAARRALLACVYLCAILFGLGRDALAGAILTHRYSFDVDASDSIGGAGGTLLNGAIVTNGALVLDGVANRMQFPANMFTNYDSISFEVWFVEEGFYLGPPGLYAFLNCCDTSKGMLYTTDGQGAYNVGVQQVNIVPTFMGVTNHFIWTQDSNSHTASIYINALLAGLNTNFTNTPALLGPTPNCWLGWRGAGPVFGFKGRILEFRAYSNALSSLEAAWLDAAGPDLSNPTPGSLLGVRPVIRTLSGPGASLPVTVFADYENLSNVNVSGQPEVTLSSDNTNVAIVTNNLKVVTTGFGTANITASYLGLSNSTALTVATPQDFTLAHRYSFNEVSPDLVPHDSVGGANGRPVGVTMSGGQLRLAGFSGYLSLPSNIISCLSEVSIEAWVTWTNANKSYPRVFDFGSQYFIGGNLRGKSYFYFSPNGPTNAVTAISTNDTGAELPRRLNGKGGFPLGVETHVAVTYSPLRGAYSLYLNGSRVDGAGAIIPLSAINDFGCWLGRSQFSVDSYFGGSMNEFRIYDGFLADADVAADYATGPDVVGVDYTLFAVPSGTNLTMSWRPPMAGWTLKSSPELGTNAVWNDVGIPPTFQNGRYSVAVGMSNAPQFFRLSAPQ